MSFKDLNLIDNQAINGREEKFDTIEVDTKAIIDSWKISLFSFEWLTPDGKIRKPEQLPEAEREKYNIILNKYNNGEALERPILGIGVMNNIEIGSKRDIFLTLAANGAKTISVHIPWSNRNDFTPFT